MLSYHSGAFDGSAAYAATTSTGRSTMTSTSTSTLTCAPVCRSATGSRASDGTAEECRELVGIRRTRRGGLLEPEDRAVRRAERRRDGLAGADEQLRRELGRE